MSLCEVWQLNTVDYAEALALQVQLVQERSQNPATPDRLLLLQHPHTYTLGTAADENNLVFSESERATRGIQLFRIDRGGDVTYHGPGQWVGYPIMQLPRTGESLRIDVHGYVQNIEEVVIRTLADYGIEGLRITGLTGVWVETAEGPQKVCAIGVRINTKAVTKHGFALNVNTDLDYFTGIVPCGIADKGVTSMARLLGAPMDEAAVAQRLVVHFGAVFAKTMHAITADLSGQTSA